MITIADCRIKNTKRTRVSLMLATLGLMDFGTEYTRRCECCSSFDK